MGKKSTNVVFSQRLKELRTEKELSQGELAKELGISRASIINYENGERIPDVEFAQKIADYFFVTVDYLIGRIDARIKDNEFISICERLGISSSALTLFAFKKMQEPHNLETLNIMLDSWNDLLISQILYWTRKHAAFKASDMINDKLYFFRFCKDNKIEIKEEDKDLTLEELEMTYLTKKKQHEEWEITLSANRKLNNNIDSYDNKQYCEFVIQSALHELVESSSIEYINRYNLTNIDNLNKFFNEQCMPSDENDAECMKEPQISENKSKYPDLEDMFVTKEIIK